MYVHTFQDDLFASLSIRTAKGSMDPRQAIKYLIHIILTMSIYMYTHTLTYSLCIVSTSALLFSGALVVMLRSDNCLQIQSIVYTCKCFNER